MEWYPEEKKIIWKDYEILVDGKGIAFDHNDTDTVSSNFKTMEEALQGIGVKVEKTDENGMVVFWFTTIIDSL